MKKHQLRSLCIFSGALALLLSAQVSSACVRLPDTDIALIGSYQSGQQTSRGSTTEFKLGGCKPFEGQYIVLTSAPVYTNPVFTKVSSPEAEIPEEVCYIDNSPFKVSKPQDVHYDEFYQSQTKFLNTCMEVEVTDLSGLIDAKQPAQMNCEVTPVSLNKVIVKGPRCAFKISNKSEFVVNYRLNSSCLNKTFLKQVGELRPMDIKADLGIYKTDDLTPNSPNYEILTLTDARVTLQPANDLIPVSTYSGTVGSEWPMQFGAQVELGRINLSTTKRLRGAPYVYLRVPFLVNNNCKETCKDGLCTSPCDFYAPFNAEMSIAKKAANDTSFHGIDYWYQGSVAPPRFVGEMSLGKAISDPDIKIGDRYLITAKFSNPSMLYRTLNDQAKQLMIKLDPVYINTTSVGRASGLTGLGTLLDIGSNFLLEPVELPTLGRLNEGEMDTSAMLRSLNAYIGIDDTWPPYYTNVINEDQSDNANRVYQTLKIGFKVTGITPTGAVVMGDLTYFKDSKIFGNYVKVVTNPPHVECPH